MSENYEIKYLKYKKKYIILKNNLTKSFKISKDQLGGKKKLNKELNNKELENKLYFFKAEWCGHCKNFKPVWNQLKKKYKKDIEFIEMDSDINKKEFLDWGIQGFPTIIFRKNTNAIEYNGNRDIKSISKFCNEMKKIKY